MKIIYITGEPAQGKSTFSKMLKGHYFEMDKMYCAYKRERGIMYKFDQSDWTTWDNYTDLEEYKKNFYQQFNWSDIDTLIIDSTTTAIKRERDLIEEVLKPTETEMFIIKSAHHEEQYLNKFKHLSEIGSKKYYKYKKSLFQKGLEPCEKTTIIKYERLTIS